MAFIRTIDVVTTNGNTYESSEEFTTEHGPLGTENTNYITDSSITLNEDKDGVKKYISEVVGRDIRLLGRAPESSGNEPSNSSSQETKESVQEDDLPF